MRFLLKTTVFLFRKQVLRRQEAGGRRQEVGGRRQGAGGIPINKFRGFNKDAVFLVLRVSKYMFFCFA